MHTCASCKALLRPGETACPACRQGPGPDATSPRLSEIEKKIARARFFRDELRQVGWPGFLVGGAVGAALVLGMGAVLWLRERGVVSWGDPAQPRALFDELAIAGAIIIVFAAVVGACLAMTYVGLVKPVFAAIFWDVARYEREYGEGGRKRRRPDDE